VARTHYQLLGIEPKATRAEIDAALTHRESQYRDLVRTGQRPKQQIIERVRKAHATLVDPDARAAQIRALFESIQSGRFDGPRGENRFFVLGLAPNAARIAVRFWHAAPLQSIAARICAWFDDLEIETVNSHHSGVPESAFLVKADGLTIIHAGDYVGRMGDFNSAPSNVPADMDYLKTKSRTIDLLFLDAFVADYQIQILQSLKPSALFPMHRGGQEERLKPFAADLKKAGVDIPVHCPAKLGDRFEYRNGKIVH